MRRDWWSTRNLMLVTAAIGVDVAMIIQADRIGPESSSRYSSGRSW